ncbi:MAG: PEP-CTERM sorting domain-containing protein [Planctomycetota bacterium]
MRKTMISLAVLASLWSSHVRADNFTVEDLYGTWTGTWFVDEMFDQNGDPVGQPPYDPVDLLFVLHAFNEVLEEYGWVFPDTPIGNPGRVVLMEVDGADVLMKVEYDPLAPLSTITGVLSGAGAMLSGDYDDFVPPAPGFVGLLGPFEATLVPEPATLLPLVLVGSAGMALLRRRG